MMSRTQTSTMYLSGSFTLSYTASDLHGNSTTNFRTVVVEDTTTPLITLNGAATLINECHSAFVDPGATASYLCAGVVAVTTNGPVNTNVTGSYTITYKASHL